MLAHITLANVEYKDHTVKNPRPNSVEPWFSGEREVRLLPKQAFPSNYGDRFPVTKPYERHLTATWGLVNCWVQLNGHPPALRSLKLTGPEVDDPKGASENLIKGVMPIITTDEEEISGEISGVRALLLKAIKVLKAT